MMSLLRTSLGFIASLVAILAAVSVGIVMFDQQSVSYVSVSGDLDERQLNAVRNHLAGLELEQASVEDVKAHVQELSWIHHANIMKDWPAGFSIEVFKEELIAYWNDTEFISDEGKVLRTDLLVGGDLPHLYGPEGSEFTVMNQYQQLSRSVSGAGFTIEVLRLNDRGAWTFETSNQIQVLLGKDDLLARVERFLNVSNELKQNINEGTVGRMDARYANGVAVHFQETEIEIADLNNSVGEQSL